MARKKKSDAGGIFILIVIVVLILITLVTPIVIIIGYLYNKINASKIRKRISGNMSDFWLNEQEKTDFKEKVNQLIKINDVIEQANQEGTNAGINKNKDGSFSARSNLGKKIRATLEKHEPIKSSLSDSLYSLKNLPISRWAKFNKYIKNAKSFIWSFFSWTGVLLSYFIILGKQSLSEVYIPYLALATNFFRDESNKLPIVDGDIQMVAVATVISILTYFIFGFIFKNSGSKYSPRPDKVTLENVDSY